MLAAMRAQHISLCISLEQSSDHPSTRCGARSSCNLSISLCGRGGWLIGYGTNLEQIYRNIWARQLVKLLRGAKPADTPVEQPTKFELVVNLKTAVALGLTIPESFLLRADKVIE